MADRIYTVSQLNKYIKQRFTDDVVLNNVILRGEISNFKVHTSGHCYFTLKDNSSSIKCVAFRSSAMRWRFAPQSGMKVIAEGYVSVYERDGAYQLYVQTLVPEGIGELTLALEHLKEKLSAEGIFDSCHKQVLPFYPHTVGVVTSRTGAVIRDICKVARRRNPLVKIVLFSVLVQGENAAGQIAEGIDFFNKKYPVDVIIVGRGGGSMEDLWAFNEEIVVRAIFNSKIPVISAVGHETDYTLSDLVSDVRAATPSQAAELAVPERDALLSYTDTLQKELTYKYCKQLEQKRSYLKTLLQNSLLMHKDKLLISYQQNLDVLTERLHKSAQLAFKDKFHQIALLNEKLQALNPENVLKRGYSLIKKKDTFVKSVQDVNLNDFLQINLTDGTIDVQVINITEQEK